MWAHLAMQNQAGSCMYVGYSWIMINIFTYECDFLHYKKIHNTFANKCCIFKDQMVWNPSLFIFLVINSYITFIESKNLIKNLFSLSCQELPQNTYKNVFCQNSKNVRVLTRGLLLYDCVLFFVKRVLVGWVRGENAAIPIPPYCPNSSPIPTLCLWLPVPLTQISKSSSPKSFFFNLPQISQIFSNLSSEEFFFTRLTKEVVSLFVKSSFELSINKTKLG